MHFVRLGKLALQGKRTTANERRQRFLHIERDAAGELGHRPFGSQGKPIVPKDKQECLCY